MFRSLNRSPVMRLEEYTPASDGGRALDVVVETEHPVPVLLQQRIRIRCLEILELDQRVRIPRVHG
jgi:hypothetical protein